MAEEDASIEPREEFHKGLVSWRKSMQKEFFIPLYKIGLRDLQAGMGMEAAGSQIGWRVVASDEKGGVYLCTMSMATATEPASLISVTPGELAQKAYEAVAPFRAQAEPHDLDIRWLSIPGVCAECLWLIPRSGGQPGVMQLLATLDPELLEQPQFQITHFLDTIRKLAEIRLSVNDTPQY